MIPLEVTLDRAGRTPYRLTDKLSNLRWTTAAVGGFGSCTFTLPGPPPFWKRELPHLAMLRVVLDTFVIWEGRIEDVTFSLLDETTSVTCFGLQRLLSDVSVRRIWSKRDIQWIEPTVPRGSAINTVPYTRTATPLFDSVSGNFDATDLTKSGTQFSGTGSQVQANEGEWLEWIAPSGLSLVLWLGTQTNSGADAGGASWSANWTALESGVWTSKSTGTAAGTSTFSITLANATAIRIGVFNAGALATFSATDRMQHYNQRVLGTSVTENAVGGFYGGTILRDLIALVPGLTIGVIDAGSDFTIQSLERSVRDTSLSVVSEVAAYYTREWRVWEDGRFDWKAVNPDEPQWIATLADLDSGSELTTTVDDLAKTLYLLYADAASGLDAESSASSSAQGNPFVKQGGTKDVLASPGFPMTSSSSSQLASKLVGESNYPPVQGRIVIPATKVIKRASGSPLPAFMIRAGENIVISDLPKTDLFSQGRDGESLFHIVSTETSLEDGSVTLEIEGQTRRSDVLLARLAAATRILTG